VRIGVRQTIELHFPGAQVSEVASGADVLPTLLDQPCDLLILDINLPGRTGLDLIPELRHEYPRLQILVLTAFGEDQVGVRLLKGGVAGFISKEASTEQLVEAISRVVAGGKYISLQLAERIAMLLDTTAAKLPHETLSNREFQIVRMLAGGQTVSEIAHELSLDARTIGTFRRHILRKLDLKSTQEIMVYAIRNGLVE
jgi:DNA-binding NarL/FixJ family response regulator